MKDVKGYEGLYGITMTGRVWSYKSKKFLKPSPNRKKFGYLCVKLCKNGETKCFMVHRLVAETYIPNPDNKPHVGHIDDNPLNNDWSNLYWTTALNNNNYGSHAKSYRGAKKTICLETGEIFRTTHEAAEKLGLDQSNISAVCNGKRKTTGGYHFEFVKECEE